MFNKLTKKFTKKIINDVKENINEEVQKKVDTSMPMIFGLAVLGLTILTIVEPQKSKISDAGITIINNYYFCNGGCKR